MPEDDQPNLAETLVALLLMVPAALWAGFVTSKLWSWFGVPLGGPEVSASAAAGLITIWNTLTFKLPKKEDKSPLASLLYGACLYLVALGLGWALHWFGGS